MYHVEQNLSNEDVSFIKDFLHTNSLLKTAYYIGVEEFSPRFVARIRYNTSDKRFARLMSNYRLSGNTEFGMIIYYENETGGMIRVGSTNAPVFLMKNFRIFFNINLDQLLPGYAMADEAQKSRILMHTIETLMYADDRKLMKEFNVIIDCHSVIHSTLPMTFFTLNSAADFVSEYRRETGEKCYVYNRKFPDGYEDDIRKMAAILKKLRFNGPYSEKK